MPQDTSGPPGQGHQGHKCHLLENDVKDSICKSANRQSSVQRLLQPKLEDSLLLVKWENWRILCSRPVGS